MGLGVVELTMRAVSTAAACEELVRRAEEISKRQPIAAQEAAWRAVAARDTHTLRVLEQQAEMITKIEEEQRGRTKRDSATIYAERRDVTEVSAWKQAYTTAADGKPNMAFINYYTAAATYAGVVVSSW